MRTIQKQELGMCKKVGNTAFILILSLYQRSSEKSRKYGIFTTSYMLVST
jgi:hypothetical protein